MSSQSIVFFDIDGTLLDFNKQLPQSAKRAILKLKEQGTIVAIATGRAPFMFENLRKELGIDTYVSYNGQYVVAEGEVIFRNPLNKKAIIQLTEEALKNGLPVVYMDQEDMKANVPEHHYITESIQTLKIDRFPTHDPLYYEGRDLYQTLLFCTPEEEPFYVEKFPQFDFVRWHPVSVDILPKGGSKLNGIQKIMEKLHILPENVYAFGDGLNDMEMLTHVANSVAMGNGLTEVKEVAKYVTKSVDEDGIEHGLKQVGLLS
jgi:Cof subfamily protein (haloacid dehalogenase superfamily)